ncbi:TPA: hypothetical protein NJY08_005052 [Salmonella enterica subsp. enterica serovar Typhi str. AG3]|nr:hypothetical protein [Salmonella enterica subsp. enterica serovar Typhi str. AG3]
MDIKSRNVIIQLCGGVILLLVLANYFKGTMSNILLTFAFVFLFLQLFILFYSLTIGKVKRIPKNQVKEETKKGVEL